MPGVIAPVRRPALAPDARRLVFVAATPDGRVLLWLRSLDGLASQPLAGTEGGPGNVAGSGGTTVPLAMILILLGGLLLARDAFRR